MHNFVALPRRSGNYGAMTANRAILEAIATKRPLTSTYNGTSFVLAPHILYTRRDLVYLDAVPLSKNGAPPREEKMATFKVDGMADIAIADGDFPISALFESYLEKYRGTTLFSVDA
ncbi:hypothetical protein D5I55_12535 [Chakrabartia godavariana]|nr:hypothetical protein D5I55_12535 [Chakrabartia godavariana]